MTLGAVAEELTAPVPAPVPITAFGTLVVKDMPSLESYEIDEISTGAAVSSGGIAAQDDIGTGGDRVGQAVGGWLTVPAAPDVHIDAHARSLVTDVVEQVLNGLFRLIRLYARDSFVQIAKIEVTAFVDPEEGTKEIVVTQWIRARPSFALDYWDEFGVAMTQWISELPNYLQEIAYDRISVAVESDEA